MSTSPKRTKQTAIRIDISEEKLIVDLDDGRQVAVPLSFYPRLAAASQEERDDWRLIGDGEGIHWPQIDEDLSVFGIVQGWESK